MTDKFIATLSGMEAEIPMLRMLSNMGVQDNEKQVSLRESLGSELEESLAKVEKNDATYDALKDIFFVLFKKSTRDKFPELRDWLSKEKDTRGNHPLGEVRIGDQIDRRPISTLVASACDRSRLLNEGVKKKKSQRDLEKEKKAKKKSVPEKPKEEKKVESTKADPLSLGHNEARDRLWKRLKSAGITPYREKEPDLEAERPVGHSTHNLFLKAKETKKKYFYVLVTVKQDTHVNLKELQKTLKVKSLRMAKDKSAMCLDHGCITVLQLYNDTAAQIVPIIENSLMKEKTLRICAGCEDPLDHSQHNVVDIPPSEILKLLQESGHGDTVKFMDF